MKLLETLGDHDIKNDLQHFIDEDYIGRFTKEENDFALKLSFLFNHSEIQDGNLVFTFGNQSIKITIDESIPNPRETHFHFIMQEEFFDHSLKAHIRDNKINKIIND